MACTFTRKASTHTGTFGLPHLEIDISPGTLTLIDPDVYSLDHISLLRVIASSNKPRLVMVADEPVDLFESRSEEMLIAWRYRDVAQKPLLDLGRCVPFQNDSFESVRSRFDSVVTIFSEVDSYELKRICRRNRNTAFVACPNMPYLHFDTVLKIRSLLFEDLGYHGLIEVKKARDFCTLRVERMRTRVYGFRIKRNGVLVEDVVVPPDGG